MRAKDFVERFEKRNFLIYASMLVMSAAVFPIKSTLGVALGGAISILAFHTLKGFLKRTLGSPAHKAKLRAMVFHYMRMGFLFCLFGAVLAYRIVEPLGLILGLSVVVVNIMFAAVGDRKKIEMMEVKES